MKCNMELTFIFIQYILMDYYPGVIESKDIAFDGEGETTEYPGDAFGIEIIEE